MELMVAIGGGVLALIAAIVLAVKQGRSAGFSKGKQEAEQKADEKLDKLQNEHNEEIIKQHEEARKGVSDVKEIHDRLDRDDTYSDGVRTRFTRD